jgi:hypothetical protein
MTSARILFIRGIAVVAKGGKLSAMKSAIFAAFLVLCAAPLAGQAPASPAAKTHIDPLGFSYSVPADWELIDLQPALPAVRQQLDKGASAGEKKGMECTQVTFGARHGNPSAVIIIVALPYDCFGHKMTDSDLPAFGLGSAEGLKKSWNTVDPVYGAYTLGSYSVWIERATGNPIGHPELVRTIEVVCGILKSAGVCWMTMAVDDASLKVFEQGQVVLDSDSPVALVPPEALAKKLR